MHGIAPYTFKVIDENGVTQDLWNINGISFLSYLRDTYFKSIYDVSMVSQEAADGVVGKNYILDQLFHSTETSVAGRISTGEFGYEAQIFDNQKKSYTGKREKYESTMLPFYFCFYSPKTTNSLDHMIGVLLLSRFNSRGIRSIVLPHLVANFDSAFPGLRLVVEKVVPTSFVNAVLRGAEIKKIRLTTNKLPENYRDVLTAADFDNVYEVETVIKPRPRSFFSKPDWMSSLSHGVPVNTIVSVPNSEVTKLKVEIATGKGRSRTVNIADVNRMVANIEIDKPEITSANHISSNCWMREADSLADDYFLELGLRLSDWKNLVTVMVIDKKPKVDIISESAAESLAV